MHAAFIYQMVRRRYGRVRLVDNGESQAVFRQLWEVVSFKPVEDGFEDGNLLGE